MMVQLVILDRDGVINRERGHVTRVEDFEILDGVGEAIFRLNHAGIKVCVASNQSGLARGILTQSELYKMQNLVECELIKFNARIERWFYSPWYPNAQLANGVQDWLGEHQDRKPNPGMLIKAMAEVGVTSEESMMVGDSAKDVKAAESVGVRFLGVKSNKADELHDQVVYDSLSALVSDFLKS